MSVLAAGLLTVFTQLNYPSDEWRHNYLHPQLCAPTGDPAAFAIVTQAIFSLLELDENDVCSSIRPWGLPIIDLGRPPSWADIYFGCRVAPVCPVCWDKKCLLQKQLAQSPGHLSTIANITPPGHRVNPPPPPRPRTRPTRKRRRVFTGRQRPKTLTTSFGFTAQTRRLRQPRPAAAAAADQNSSNFGGWGR